jgi:hypothetical protein
LKLAQEIKKQQIKKREIKKAAGRLPFSFTLLQNVVPAKAGTQVARSAMTLQAWIPAFAGMTPFYCMYISVARP